MAKLILSNGKEIEFELTNEQIKVICEADKPAKLTGWERVKKGEEFWCIDECGKIVRMNETGLTTCDERYNIGNYFSTYEMAERVKLKQDIERKMLRFAELNDKVKLDWSNYSQKKYYIEPICGSAGYYFEIGHHWGVKLFGIQYFSSKELANNALEIFHEDLKKCYNTKW